MKSRESTLQYHIAYRAVLQRSCEELLFEVKIRYLYVESRGDKYPQLLK
jgi:hypothetical protein